MGRQLVLAPRFCRVVERQESLIHAEDEQDPEGGHVEDGGAARLQLVDLRLLVRPQVLLGAHVDLVDGDDERLVVEERPDGREERHLSPGGEG